MPGRTMRVATKFTNIANRYFLSKGQQVDVVYVQGSVELAPLTGLADVIVDIVESGETLRQNGLSELEYICEISSVCERNCQDQTGPDDSLCDSGYRCSTASACVKSMRPLRNARMVNSPGSASRALAATHISTMCRKTTGDPCAEISTTSSVV